MNKSDLAEKDIPALADIVGDEDKAKEIVEAAKASMGNGIECSQFSLMMMIVINSLMVWLLLFVFRPGSVTS